MDDVPGANPQEESSSPEAEPKRARVKRAARSAFELAKDVKGRVDDRGGFAAIARERPFATLASATAVGALLGGVVFRGAGRLVFLGAAGLVVSELWKSEGGEGVRGLVERLAGED